MKRIVLAIATLMLVAGATNAAPKKGYKIVVSIKNAKDTVLYVVSIMVGR